MYVHAERLPVIFDRLNSEYAAKHARGSNPDQPMGPWKNVKGREESSIQTGFLFYFWARS